MITKAEQRCIAKYGTSKPEEIVKLKMGGQCKSVPAIKSATARISAADCQALCMLAGLEYLDGYEGRVIEYTLSDEHVDRDGDIMIQNGANLDSYKSNPVVLLFHDARTFPVGNCIKIWVDLADRTLKGWILFLDDRVDPSGTSERAFRFAKSRAMRAGSIGFQGTEVKFPTTEERKMLGMKDWGVIFTGWEMYEFSLCPVPSNPNAMADALRKGVLLPEDLKFIETEKPEDEVLNMTKEELSALVDTNLKKAIAEVTEKSGKPISAANLQKMQDITDKMDACHKAYKDEHKIYIGEMKAFLLSHAQADTDDDGDTDANPTDGDKPKKMTEAEQKALADASEDAEMQSLMAAFKDAEVVKK